jgi:hypothetical protein
MNGQPGMMPFPVMVGSGIRAYAFGKAPWSEEKEGLVAREMNATGSP